MSHNGRGRRLNATHHLISVRRTRTTFSSSFQVCRMHTRHRHTYTSSSSSFFFLLLLYLSLCLSDVLSISIYLYFNIIGTTIHEELEETRVTDRPNITLFTYIAHSVERKCRDFRVNIALTQVTDTYRCILFTWMQVYLCCRAKT